MCLRVNRILKEGKREGFLCKKLFQRLWPWVDTTLEWADARTKESWQWDYLLAKKWFSDDVLASCVRWLGSHHRRKPMSCMAHEAALAHASSHQGGSSWTIPSMRCDRMVCGRWPWYTIIWAAARPCSCWPHPHQGGSCRVVDAACPGLLMVTFLSYSKIP